MMLNRGPLRDMLEGVEGVTNKEGTELSDAATTPDIEETIPVPPMETMQPASAVEIRALDPTTFEPDDTIAITELAPVTLKTVDDFATELVRFTTEPATAPPISNT